MKKGTWISIIPGLLSLSLSLGLVLILSNWTAFVLLRWPSYLWFLLVAAFSFIPFFIVNHWLTKRFEALSQQERNVLYLVLFAFITFVFLTQFPDSQSTFMTWATLMLAFIAFGGIMYSLDQARRNERLRKEDRKENERLRKADREESERLRKEEKEENRRTLEEERSHRLQSNTLDLICDWAEAVEEYIFFVDFPHNMDTGVTIRAKLLGFSIKGNGVLKHSLIFGEELQPLIKALMDDILDCVDFIAKISHEALTADSITNKDEIFKSRFTSSNWALTEDNSRKKIRNSSLALQDKAIELRLKLQI